MNTFQGIGRLGRDPQPWMNGTTRTSTMWVAFEEPRKGGDKIVTWVNVRVFNGLADICNRHLCKGRLIGVIGKIRSRSYKTKNGEERREIYILATEITFLDNKKTPSSTFEVEEMKTEEEETNDTPS